MQNDVCYDLIIMAASSNESRSQSTLCSVKMHILHVVQMSCMNACWLVQLAIKCHFLYVYFSKALFLCSIWHGGWLQQLYHPLKFTFYQTFLFSIFYYLSIALFVPYYIPLLLSFSACFSKLHTFLLLPNCKLYLEEYCYTVIGKIELYFFFLFYLHHFLRKKIEIHYLLKLAKI